MRALIPLLLSTLLTCPALATVPADKLDALLVQSGLDAQIEAMPDIISAGIEQGFRQSGQMDAVPPNLIENMQAVARASYAAEPMRAKVYAAVNSSLNEAQADDNLSWLNGELGQSITAAEVATGTTAGIADMQVYIQNLQDHTPTTRRIAQIEAIDNAADVSETAMRIQRNTLLVMLVSMNAAAPSELQRSFDDISGLTDQLLSDAIRRDLVLQTSLQLVYTYRNVADDTLDAYVAHLESPSGTAFSDASASALEQALFDAGALFGEELANLIAESEGETNS